MKLVIALTLAVVVAVSALPSPNPEVIPSDDHHHHHLHIPHHIIPKKVLPICPICKDLIKYMIAKSPEGQEYEYAKQEIDHFCKETTVLLQHECKKKLEGALDHIKGKIDKKIGPEPLCKKMDCC